MDDSSWSTLTPNWGFLSLSVIMGETASFMTLETLQTLSTTSGWENEFFCFLCYFSLLCIFAGRNVCKTWIFDSIMPLKKKLSKKQAAFLKVKFLDQSCIYNFVHIVLNYCYKEVAQIQKRNMAFCKTSLISFSSALSLFHSQTHTRIQLLWRCAAAWVWGRLQSINRTRPSSVCCHDPEPTSTNSLILASKTPFLWIDFLKCQIKATYLSINFTLVVGIFNT